MMQVIGSTSVMQSRSTVAGVLGKNSKVRQAAASTSEAPQPTRSAQVRPEESVSFVDVGDISLGRPSQ